MYTAIEKQMKQNNTYTYIIATENEIEYINTLKITTTKHNIYRKPCIQTAFSQPNIYKIASSRTGYGVPSHSAHHQYIFLQLYIKFRTNTYSNKIVMPIYRHILNHLADNGP